MSRIRGKNTGPERALSLALTDLGLVWEAHAGDLPGRPDFTFRDERVVVFTDGDYWHGWRFNEWRHKLSEAWEAKIAKTRSRDRRTSRELRQAGWTVIRLWEHEINQDAGACCRRINKALGLATAKFGDRRLAAGSGDREPVG